MNSGDNTDERLFRRAVEHRLVFHTCMFLSAVSGLVVGPPSWLGPVVIAALPFSLLRIWQSLNARRYAVGIAKQHVRLIYRASAVVLDRVDLLSVSYEQVPSLRLVVALVLVCHAWFVAAYLLPETIPPSLWRFSLFGGPILLAQCLALPWLVRALRLSAAIAVAGSAVAVVFFTAAGSLLGAVLVAAGTGLVLWTIHRVRLWRVCLGLTPVGTIAGVGIGELSLAFRPRFLLAQISTGTRLLVLWKHDGSLLAHPFEPDSLDRDETEEYGKSFRSFLGQHLTRPPSPIDALRVVSDSQLDVQRGHLGTAIAKCRDLLGQCEASGAIALGIQTAGFLVEHLVTAVRGLEAAELAERYKNTARDSGQWMTVTNLNSALANTWAHYGELNRATAYLRASLREGRKRQSLTALTEARNNLGMCYLMRAGLLRHRGALVTAERAARSALAHFRSAQRTRWWMRWLSLGHQITWETSLVNEAEALRVIAELRQARRADSGDAGGASTANSFHRAAVRQYRRWLHHSERSSLAGGDQLSAAALAFAAVGAKAEAHDLFKHAIRLAHAHPDDVYHLFVAHKRYADYLLNSGKARSAHEEYEAAMWTLEDVPVLQTAAFTRYYGGWERHQLFASAIRAAIALQDPESAMLDAERSRQEGFRQIVRGTIGFDGGLNHGAEERINKILEEILSKNDSTAGGGDKGPNAGATWGSQREAEEPITDDVWWVFRTLADRIRGSVQSVSDIRDHIPEQAAVVLYHEVDGLLWAFCVRRDRPLSQPLMLASTRELEELLIDEYLDGGIRRRTPRLLEAEAVEKRASRELCHRLIEPLLPELESVTRLYVVPTRPLIGCPTDQNRPPSGVPFAALRDEKGRRLIDEDGLFPRGIAYLPCLTMPRGPRRPGGQQCRPDVVFLFGEGFSDVAESPTVVVERTFASAGDVLNRLATSRVGCFHTHGVPFPPAPLLAGLMATSGLNSDPAKDVLLLTGLHCLAIPASNRADVVLTPCSTASVVAEYGHVAGGEELLGFVLPMLLHADVVIGCLREVAIEHYQSLSRDLRNTDGAIDAIQVVASWQREQIRAADKHVSEWAWPMVWTNLGDEGHNRRQADDQ